MVEHAKKCPVVCKSSAFFACLPPNRLCHRNSIRGCKGIEPDSCEGSVANILHWLEFMCPFRAALRPSSSEEAKREEKRVLAWLRRSKVLFKRLYQWPAGFESFRVEVMRWEAVYEQGRMCRLSRLPRVPGIQRTIAYEKRFAGEVALRLCDEFGVKLTKTKRGAFCKLAAMRA